MMFVLWIIPYKSFKKSAKIQTKIKKFNMVNLFSITYRATTFLRDMITNNEQKDPMSTSYFWEKKLFTFWWFYSTLEGTSFYYSVHKVVDSNNCFWTSSVQIYQSLQFQIKIYVICWLWFQLENKQKWQEFLIFICKCFSFLILCDCADTLSLFFMILETLSKSFQL